MTHCKAQTTEHDAPVTQAKSSDSKTEAKPSTAKAAAKKLMNLATGKTEATAKVTTTATVCH